MCFRLMGVFLSPHASTTLFELAGHVLKTFSGVLLELQAVRQIPCL